MKQKEVEYKTKNKLSGQNLLDVAIQEYGSVEGVFKLWNDNRQKQVSLRNITNVMDLLEQRSNYRIRKNPELEAFPQANYDTYQEKKQKVCTGLAEGISIWTVYDDFVIS